jgi:hypothetical protein
MFITQAKLQERAIILKRKRSRVLFTFTLLSALSMHDVSSKSILTASNSGFSMTLQAGTKRNVSIEDVLSSKTTMKILAALRKFERLLQARSLERLVQTLKTRLLD